MAAGALLAQDASLQGCIEGSGRKRWIVSRSECIVGRKRYTILYNSLRALPWRGIGISHVPPCQA
jgi:hypothetical protein